MKQKIKHFADIHDHEWFLTWDVADENGFANCFEIGEHILWRIIAQVVDADCNELLLGSHVAALLMSHAFVGVLIKLLHI